MRVAFRVLWRALRMGLHLLLGLLLTAITARRDRVRGSFRYHPGLVGWWHERLLHILGVEVTYRGEIPRPPALLVSNHISWLDIPVLASQTQTSFLSKDEIRRWPIIGWLAAGSGTLFIRRGAGDAGSIAKQLADHLSDDGLLTLFPEGTTTDGNEVRPFFPRLFAAGIDSGAPVVPVALRYHINGELDTVAPYTGDQHVLDNLWQILKRQRTEVQVTYTTPLALAGVARKVAAEQARNQIVQALADSATRTPPLPAQHQAG